MELIYEAGGGFLHEPDEWLPGTLTQLLPEEGQFGPSIKWVVILDEDIQNGEGRETWAWTSQTFTSRSKAYEWTKAINPGLIPALGRSPRSLAPAAKTTAAA